MDNINQLETLGLTMPTPAYLFGMILFSVVGYAAYRYGKRMERIAAKWLGVLLMIYPYAIAETWQLYAVGAALTASLFVFRG
jgi:uncharacterized membrane protein